MSFQAIEDLLKGAMGLDAASITPAAVERAARRRMAAQGVEAAGAYAEMLRASEVERQELIEEVVVSETWFFRDRQAFAALGSIAFESWPRVRPEGVLRLLSLPCATGEEPYSMAMALFDAGLPEGRFQVDAVDISQRALERAKGAVYGKNSFRGDDLGFRDRYFEPAFPGWRLAEKVRARVRFERANIMDLGFLPGEALYDAIFCRNVLIYFDVAAQERAINALERLLTPDGVLFMGPSEVGLLPGTRFASARIPHAFAFRKRGPVSPKPLPSGPAAKRKNPRPLPVPAPIAAAKRPATPLPVAPPIPRSQAASVPNDDALLEAAMHLADQGRLSEASAQCEAHLREHGPSVRGFYLLGLMRDAAGDRREAASFYRKALYLDPRNGEVLAHLSALLESQGEAKEARMLNERVRRLSH